MLPGEAAGPYDVAGEPRLAEALVTPHEEAKIRGLARTLRAAIFSGQYAAGEQLPTRTAMAKANDVSTQTIGNVMLLLAGEGLVRLEQGRGTFVQPVRRHRAVVTARREDGGEITGEAFDEAVPRLRAVADADLAEVEATAAAGELEITLMVIAADAGYAAGRASAVARSALGDGWEITGASADGD